MLVTGLIVAYGYSIEAFMAWYSAEPVRDVHDVEPHAPGRTGGRTALLIFCNVVTPQSLWFKRVRTSVPALFVISIIVNIGMWLERFVIVVTSLHRDFLPSSWGRFSPTIWDFATYFGTIGLFLTLLFLFLRFLPMISIFEMRTLLPAARVDEDAEGGTERWRTRTPTHSRPDGRVRGPERPRRGGLPRPATRATARWTPTRRSRSRNCTRRSACITPGCRSSC